MSASSADLYRSAVRRLWSRRAFSLIAIAAAFAVLALPAVSGTRGRPLFFGGVLTSAMVGLSMNVLVGYAGQISLSQAALYGGGAFAIGNFVTRAHMPWLVSLPMAGLMTAALAMIIGFPALRVRGLNLAILTLGFQFLMEKSLFLSNLISPGAAGIDIPPPKVFGVTLENQPMVLAVGACLLFIWLIDRNLTRSRAGRAFFALRQDEQVASSFGIPVSRYKLLAFAISGFYAGLAGALFGTVIGQVIGNNFEVTLSIQFLIFAVLGGLGSRVGTAIGAAFPLLFSDLLSSIGFRGVMVSGVLLVVTLIQFPGGIAEQGREIRAGAFLFWRRGARWFAAFVGIALGSLGLAFLVPWLIDAIFALWHWHVSLIWAVILGLGSLATSFQVSARRLGHAAFGAESGRAAPSEAMRAILRAEAAAARGPITPLPASALRRQSSSAYRGPLLEVEDLAIRFGGVRALDGVSLQVNTGELIGIMGPNGSGKTTLLNNISGFLKPNEGDVRFRGESILGKAPHQRAALGLGRTFQNVGLVKQETVFDNFLIAQHLVCGYGAMEGLVRTGAVLSEERRLRARALAAIDLLELHDIADERIASLPHGRAKLVELGCALVTGPELLLLDEPAAGVSPQEAEALGQILKDVAENFQVTVLMIEHHVPLMLSTCDYIYVLNFGRLLTHGEPADVARHPDVIAAYLGQAAKEADLAVAGSR